MENTLQVYDYENKTPRNKFLDMISDLHDASKRKMSNHENYWKKMWNNKVNQCHVRKSEIDHEHIEVQKYEMKELIDKNMQLKWEI